jgi:hypothetical protein
MLSTDMEIAQLPNVRLLQSTKVKNALQALLATLRRRNQEESRAKN